MLATADIEQQLIAFAPLGDLQVVQRRLVRGTGTTAEAEALAAVAADQVQILTMHLDLHRPHTGQVKLEVAWRLEFAGGSERGEWGKQQDSEGKAVHGRTPVVVDCPEMQPSRKGLQADGRVTGHVNVDRLEAFCCVLIQGE